MVHAARFCAASSHLTVSLLLREVRHRLVPEQDHFCSYGASQRGRTSLLFAARSRQTEVVTQLLLGGADVDATNAVRKVPEQASEREVAHGS